MPPTCVSAAEEGASAHPFSWDLNCPQTGRECYSEGRLAGTPPNLTTTHSRRGGRFPEGSRSAASSCHLSRVAGTPAAGVKINPASLLSRRHVILHTRQDHDFEQMPHQEPIKAWASAEEA